APAPAGARAAPATRESAANQDAGLAIRRSGFHRPSALSLGADIGQPTVGIVDCPARYVEKALLNLRRDRPASAASNFYTIHAAHRCDFRRGTAEEDLVTRVQHLAGQFLLANLEAHVTRQLENAVPRYAVEQRTVDRRRVDDPAMHEEDVLPRSLADHPVRRERDPLGESIAQRLHLDQLAAEVVAGDLGHGGNR